MDLHVPISRSQEYAVEDKINPTLRTLYEVWSEAGEYRFAPSVRELDLMRLPSVLTRLLIAVHDDGAFRFKYWGRYYTELFGEDFTGRTPYDISPVWAGMLMDHQFRRVFETRVPIVFDTGYDALEEPILELRLPLSDDGDNVTGIIALIDPGSSTDRLSGIFANKPMTSSFGFQS